MSATRAGDVAAQLMVASLCVLKPAERTWTAEKSPISFHAL